MLRELLPRFRAFIATALAERSFKRIVLVDRKAAKLFRLFHLLPESSQSLATYRSALDFDRTPLAGAHVAILDDIAHAGRTLSAYRRDIESRGAVVDTYALVSTQLSQPSLRLDPRAKIGHWLAPDEFRAFQYESRDYLLTHALPLDADHVIATLQLPPMDPLALLRASRGFGLLCMLPYLTARSRSLCFTLLNPPISFKSPLANLLDGINKLRLYFDPSTAALVAVPIRRPRLPVTSGPPHAALSALVGPVLARLHLAPSDLLPVDATSRAVHDLTVLLFGLDLLTAFTAHLRVTGIPNVSLRFSDEQREELCYRFGSRFAELIPSWAGQLLECHLPTQQWLFQQPTATPHLPSRRERWALVPDRHGDFISLERSIEKELRSRFAENDAPDAGATATELATAVGARSSRRRALLSLALDELLDVGVAKPQTRATPSAGGTIYERVFRPGETETVRRSYRAIVMANLVAERMQRPLAGSRTRVIGPLALYKALVGLTHDLDLSETCSDAFDIAPAMHGPIPRIPNDTNPAGSSSLIQIGDLAPHMPLRYRRGEQGGRAYFYLDTSRLSNIISREVLHDSAMSFASARRIQQFGNFYAKLARLDSGLDMLLCIAMLRTGESFLQAAGYEGTACAEHLTIRVVPAITVSEASTIAQLADSVGAYASALSRKLRLYDRREEIWTGIVRVASREEGPAFAALYDAAARRFRDDSAREDVAGAIARLRKDARLLEAAADTIRHASPAGTSARNFDPSGCVMVLRRVVSDLQTQRAERSLKRARWTSERLAGRVGDLDSLSAVARKLLAMKAGWLLAVDVIRYVRVGDDRLPVVADLRRYAERVAGEIADSFVADFAGLDGIALGVPTSTSAESLIAVVEEMVRAAAAGQFAQQPVHLTATLVPIEADGTRAYSDKAVLLAYLLMTIHGQGIPCIYIPESVLPRAGEYAARTRILGSLDKLSRRAGEWASAEPWIGATTVCCIEVGLLPPLAGMMLTPDMDSGNI